jgi:hypothetical protein
MGRQKGNVEINFVGGQAEVWLQTIGATDEAAAPETHLVATPL